MKYTNKILANVFSTEPKPVTARDIFTIPCDHKMLASKSEVHDSELQWILDKQCSSNKHFIISVEAMLGGGGVVGSLVIPYP